MRYLIVGAGPAGVVAAETLRAIQPDAGLVVVGAESEPAYSRMAIPYYLAGDIGEQGTYLRHDPEHFARLRIEFLQERVQRLEPEARRVQLSQGDSLSYDRLLLATGSRPLLPQVPGVQQPAVHPCWTLEDARQILRHTTPGCRVVLLGAGFIGCILMEALVARGAQLTVLEQGERMVPRMLDPVAGGLLEHWCRERGVQVHTATRVSGIEPDPGGVHRFRLPCEGADPVAADLVVIAAGVRPNCDFLDGSGIATNRGVLVDEYLKTSVPDVFAAGDVCEGLDWSTGNRAVNAIQPAAVEHGRIAAWNMTGKQVAYRGSLAMNVLDTLGLVSASFGLWSGVDGGDSSSLLDEQNFRYLNLQFADDRLVGGIALGHTQHLGVVRGLIQSRARLGAWKRKLSNDPSRIMEAYVACASPPAVARGAR